MYISLLPLVASHLLFAFDHVTSVCETDESGMCSHSNMNVLGVRSKAVLICICLISGPFRVRNMKIFWLNLF